MKFLYITLAVLVILIFWKRTQLLALFAKLKYQNGETEKVLRLFRIANNIGTLAPNDMMYYGYVLLRSGDISAARDVLTHASINAKKENTKKQIKAMLSLVAWKEGDLDSAIEMMEDIISDFKTTNAYQNLGLMYIIKGDAEKALEFNLEAYKYNSDDLVIQDNLAESYALCGDIEKAKETYESLLEKKPHFPEAYYGYGLILVSEGQKERGVEFIRESLSKRFSFLSIKTKEEVEDLLREYE